MASRELRIGGQDCVVEYRRVQTDPGSRWEPEQWVNEISGLFVNGRKVDHVRHWKIVDRVMEKGA